MTRTHTHTHNQFVFILLMIQSFHGVYVFFYFSYLHVSHKPIMCLKKGEWKKKDMQLKSFCFVLILMTFCSNSQTKFSAHTIFFPVCIFLTGQNESKSWKLNITSLILCTCSSRCFFSFSLFFLVVCRHFVLKSSFNGWKAQWTYSTFL